MIPASRSPPAVLLLRHSSPESRRRACGPRGRQWRDGKLTGIVVNGHEVAFDMGNMSFTGVIDDKAHTMSVTAHFEGRDLWQMTVTKKDQV